MHVARAPAAVPLVASAEPDADDASLYKLPDYQPMRTFLEKTSPASEPPKVYITLTPTEAPMSLERRTVEAAARACFDDDARRADGDVTMTLETRADGTLSNGSVDGTSAEVSSCLVERLVNVPLHQEGKPEHIVIVLGVIFG